MKPLKYLGLTFCLAAGMSCVPAFAQSNAQSNANTSDNGAQSSAQTNNDNSQTTTSTTTTNTNQNANAKRRNRANLPKTASEAPLLALAGIMSLGGALVTRKLARDRA